MFYTTLYKLCAYEREKDRIKKRADRGAEMRAQHMAWYVTMATAVPKITIHTHSSLITHKKTAICCGSWEHRSQIDEDVEMPVLVSTVLEEQFRKKTVPYKRWLCIEQQVICHPVPIRCSKLHHLQYFSIMCLFFLCFISCSSSFETGCWKVGST